MDGKKGIILAFCACIILLALIGGYSYFSTSKYKEASNWVSHSQQVIDGVETIYTSAQEIETSQRGYVITGETSYLGPFDQAVMRSRETYKQVRSGVRDNPRQQTTIDKIDYLLEEKIAFATKVVELRRQSGFDAAQQMIMTHKGERLMNGIRTEIADFDKHEQVLLEQRLREAQHRFQQVINVIILLVVLSILIITSTLYLFIKDHNRRVRSEQLVRDSELRFKMMLEAIPIGVFVINTDGTPYYSNKHSMKILGEELPLNRSLAEIRLDNAFYIAGTDEPYPTSQGPVDRAFRGEATYGLDDLETVRDGERVRLRLNIIPLFNQQGHVEFVISLFEDISDLKKAEFELLSAKHMAEESLILKETFLANMSHEIRTPMNAILGFTDLLLKEQLNEREWDYVSTIRSSGENLLRIINDILDLSKIEANMMEFEEHPLNIPDTFRSLQTMLNQKAAEKKLELQFWSDPRLSGTLIGDPTRLTQIIINLVGNAIKFTKKGKVTVEANVLEEDMDSVTVDFRITDTGIGIQQDKLNAIFERFRQAETYTTRSYGGTGLGLSIARQLVELQGGRMDITSEIDKGSCFAFSLQFTKSNTQLLHKEKEEKHIVDFNRIRSMKILLAEDNPINVKLIRNLFDQHKLTVETVENGQEVIDMLQQRSFDLILMDLEMPVMNGYEATRIIRENIHSGVAIIAMTAHAMAGEQEKCLQMGMNDFVSKPINSTVLFEKMDQIARSLQATNLNQHTVEEQVLTGSSAEQPLGRINLSYLQELSSGNRDFEKEMLSLFMQQVPVELQELQQAYAQQDFSAIKNVAHKMKSSIPLVGSDYLLPSLSKLEQTGMTGQVTDESNELFTTLVTELEACFTNVQRELETY